MILLCNLFAQLDPFCIIQISLEKRRNQLETPEGFFFLPLLFVYSCIHKIVTSF